jgi:MFS superfamily sulfate permease-like transporter
VIARRWLATAGLGSAGTRSYLPIPSDHLRWVLRFALAGTAAINLTINAALAGLFTIGIRRVPAWSAPLIGGPSVVGNTLGTLVILPVTTSLLCTASIRVYQRGGLALLGPDHLPRLIRHLVVGPMRRGLRLAVLCLAAFGPLTILVGFVGAGGGLSRLGFIISQIAVGVLLGALVTPVVAVAAMAEAGPTPAPG